MVTNIVNVSDEVLANNAYARVKPELAKLAPEELMPLNLDASAALQTILAVLPEVRAFREQIVKELPSFDIASFDRLEDYAWAFGVTHTAYLMATEPPRDLQPLAAEAVELRETLFKDAQALARRGLIDGSQLSGLRGVNGYKNIAQDLQLLSEALREAWPRIQGKSATTSDELETALQMSTRLSRIVGLREQGPAQIAAAADERLRAFTLVFRTYEDTRRAVTYLRGRLGDADTIMPALHPGRPRRRPSEAIDEVTPNAPNVQTTSSATRDTGAPKGDEVTRSLPVRSTDVAETATPEQSNDSCIQLLGTPFAF